MSSSAPSQDRQRQEQLTIKSPFNPNIELFDNEEYVPDVDLEIAGLEKPLHLHSIVMIQTSGALAALYKAKVDAHGKFDPEAHRIKWMFDRTATDEKYRNCLVKWLRFCYGEDQRIKTEEMGTALTCLLQLQLKCEETVMKEMKDHLIKTASRNTAAGCETLIDCVSLIDECHREGLNSASELLADMILCRDNVVKHPEIVVDKCLLLLPPRFLDIVEYGPPHTESSGFNIRMRYIKAHDSELSKEEKLAILGNCKVKELGSKEIEVLFDTDVLEKDALKVFCLRALKSQENELLAAKKTINQLRGIDSAPELPANFESLGRSFSATTRIETGGASTIHAGAVYDSKRDLIISLSTDAASRGTVRMTHFSYHGVTEVKHEFLPKSECQAPVYDGTRYVYVFSGYATMEQFGRIDLDTFKYESLPIHYPEIEFAPLFIGCFHEGCVYAMDCLAELVCYNVGERKWLRCGIKLPVDAKYLSIALLNDPKNKSRHFYALGRRNAGGLYRIDLDERVVTQISPIPELYDLRDALLLQDNSGEFIVVTSLRNLGAKIMTWYYFSSKTGEWNVLRRWKPTDNLSGGNYLVYSPKAQSFYYHIHSSSFWETVHL